MCGFSCYLHFDSYHCSDTRFCDLDIDQSLELINHRGPDSRGKYLSPDRRCGKLAIMYHFFIQYVQFMLTRLPLTYKLLVMFDFPSLIFLVVNNLYLTKIVLLKQL